MARAQSALRRPVVWVTGASRGIGREIARVFAETGCDVCLSARTVRGLRSAADGIVRRGGSATVVPCDLLSDRSIRRACAAVLRTFGRIDVLVNCGGTTVFAPFAATPQKAFDAVVGTNLRGAVVCIREALPGMRRRREGMIINILSTASVMTFAGSSAYTAAKAGLLGFSSVLREELRTSSIRVVDVLPGATDTAMWPRASRRRHGKKMMSPAGVAEAVLALWRMPPDTVPERLLLRPIGGDIG